MASADDFTQDDNRDHGRHWYDVRPQPRSRGDLMGFNSTLWKGAGWVILVLAAIFPFPWWW